MFGKKKTAVPEWAATFGKKEYSLFMQAVDDYFRQKGDPYTIGDGIVKTGDDDWECGLSNLAQICAQCSLQDYPAVIANHFTLLFEGRNFDAQFSGMVADFEQVKQYLGVRLYDKGYMEATKEKAFVRRRFAGELYAVLVWDFPTTVRNVVQSEIDSWGILLDELFEIGLENIRNNYEFNTIEIEPGEGPVFGVSHEHFFVPNILFDLEKHPEFIGVGGAIIAAPTRSTAMIAPINDMSIMKALSKFFMFVPEFYSQGPGSLTKEIYWYKDGQFEVLDYTPGEKPKFKPSEAFLALLNGGLSPVR